MANSYIKLYYSSQWRLIKNKLFVIEDVNVTNLNFRSKYALRTKPKKYFVDPSIATAILDIKPNDLINDLKMFGFIFESLCMRDLKVYTQSYGGSLTFYRDEKDFEIDAILRTENGKWGAIEIKLGDEIVLALMLPKNIDEEEVTVEIANENIARFDKELCVLYGLEKGTTEITFKSKNEVYKNTFKIIVVE